MIDASIGEALHRLLHSYKRAMRHAHQEAGIALPISHIRALKIIRSRQDSTDDPCTAQLIAARLERDKAQIARVVKELLAEGLIDRQDNPADRRSQILRLTAQGLTCVDRIKAAEACAGARMAEGLSQDELAVFVRLATRLTDNLRF